MRSDTRSNLGFGASLSAAIFALVFLAGMRHIKLMNFYYYGVWRSLVSGQGDPH